MGWARILAAGLMLLALAGCSVGSFTTVGDFTTVAARVAPIAPGRYVVSTSPDDPGLVFELRDGGVYASPPQAGRRAPGIVRLRPARRLLHRPAAPERAEIGSSATYGNFVFSVAADQSLSIVDDLAIRHALGEVLFGALGVSGERKPPSLGALTDNAALNWAILQRAIAGYAASFTYQASWNWRRQLTNGR